MSTMTLRLVLLSAAFASGLSEYAVAAPEISAYYLSGPSAKKGTPAYYASLENLKELSDKIAAEGSNFNNLMLSFVQPSLTKYTPNSLTCTGLFGYICLKGKEAPKETTDGAADFKRLKGILANLRAHGVQTYISVGGWNFSCHPDIYDRTARTQNACGPVDQVYDVFPNPSKTIPRFESNITGSAAEGAYKNIVDLANDLGAAGIDVDYEEFWHADINAKSWTLNPDTIVPPVENGVPQRLSDAELKQLGLGEDVYNPQMEVNPGSEKYARAMPATVDKFAAILKSLERSIKSINPSLKLSTAAPATGGIPNMSANWGTVASNSGIYGGAWWGGNLYGLIYNTALLYKEEIDKLSYVGIMSYDLGERGCRDGDHPDSEIPCDLVGQVNFYYNQFATWLKTGGGLPADSGLTTSHVKLSGSRTHAKASIQPRKLLISPPITVGFEVGQPATGNLVLTKDKLTQLVDGTVKYGQVGIIMWDLFKDVRYDQENWDPTWATPKDVLKEVCTKMGLAGAHYNCKANVPR
ncbi:hypothetical protein [Bradyrhizobium sp. USDA 10063]